jgi:excisionase family DNA binding protein
MNDDRWLTVRQVSDIVQVHPETIRDWLRTGRLSGTLLSRRAGWRVRERDVQRCLAGELRDVGKRTRGLGASESR